MLAAALTGRGRARTDKLGFDALQVSGQLPSLGIARLLHLLDGEKVILKDEVLEVRNVDGRLHVARKPRKPDEWDPLIEPYDPYRPDSLLPVTRIRQR